MYYTCESGPLKQEIVDTFSAPPHPYVPWGKWIVLICFLCRLPVVGVGWGRGIQLSKSDL